MEYDLAPIILFIYNRPEHTRKTLVALQNNILAAESVLYVFADGPKANACAMELDLIEQTRAVINAQQWCKEINLVSREMNMDLEDNVIDGVTQVIKKHGKAIVLEDDIVTSPYFLQYCNDGLKVYENFKQVFSINGFMFPIDFETKEATFLCPVATSSWGWATWADRWNLFETNPSYIKEIDTDPFLRNRFNVGAQNKVIMLKHMNTWDIRWYYTAFVRNGLGAFPTKSLVENIGFDGSGTHHGFEDIVQELYMAAVPVVYYDTINLKHYSKILNFVKLEPISIRQRLKNLIKRVLRFKTT